MGCLMLMSKSDLQKSDRLSIRCELPLLFSGLVVPMYTAKRPRSGSKSDLNKDLTEACKASKVSFRSDPEEPSAKRFLPNTPIFMATTPFVIVFTVLSVLGYWNQIPDVSETVKSFVDVQESAPGFNAPPPMLPTKVPFHLKGHVDQACRAAKTAWLIESKRADFTGQEVSDVQLNKFYRRGREWYARHASNPEVSSALHPCL